MDPKVYPFVRGTACDAPWDSVEKKPGVYDWSKMDQAIERAYQDKISLYFGFEAGPSTPTWVYEKGVPKVLTNDQRHAAKFPSTPTTSHPNTKRITTASSPRSPSTSPAIPRRSGRALLSSKSKRAAPGTSVLTRATPWIPDTP